MRHLLCILLAAVLLHTSGCKKENIEVNKSIYNEVISKKSNTSKVLKYGKMSDIDGNIYKTIQIGNQVWMAENLRVTKYRNGESILHITNNDEWVHTSYGAWCYYENLQSNEPAYGKLYNWNAVIDPRGIAPKGWHIPTPQEVTTLIEYLGGTSIAGGKMKETGATYWAESNPNVTNSSGFSGRPGGYRHYTGIFSDINTNGWFWTNNGVNTYSADVFRLYFANLECTISDWYKVQGLSIRCIKD